MLKIFSKEDYCVVNYELLKHPLLNLGRGLGLKFQTATAHLIKRISEERKPYLITCCKQVIFFNNILLIASRIILHMIC